MYLHHISLGALLSTSCSRRILDLYCDNERGEGARRNDGLEGRRRHDGGEQGRTRSHDGGEKGRRIGRTWVVATLPHTQPKKIKIRRQRAKAYTVACRPPLLHRRAPLAAALPPPLLRRPPLPASLAAAPPPPAPTGRTRSRLTTLCGRKAWTGRTCRSSPWRG